MEIKYFDSHSDKNREMDPKQAIKGMYDFTKENGTLAMPVHSDDLGEAVYSYIKCDMDWTQSDCEDAIKEYESLYSKISDIKKKSDQLGDSIDENKGILTEEELAIWDTYIRDFDIGDIDYDKIQAIREKRENLETITDDERQYYDEYVDRLVEDSEKRVGSNFGAYQVVIRAKRVFKLLELGAPQIIINNETKYLAEAFVVHKFAKNCDEISLNKDLNDN